MTNTKTKNKKRERGVGIYMKNAITRKVSLPFNVVGENLKENIEQTFTLKKSNHYTGGPSRYFNVEETNNRVGFITPLTHNFCELCNRVRLTCTGKLYMCLGQDDSADFVSAARSKNWEQDLKKAIIEAISRKPKGHDFVIRRKQSPSVKRHMSVTGG